MAEDKEWEEGEVRDRKPPHGPSVSTAGPPICRCRAMLGQQWWLDAPSLKKKRWRECKCCLWVMPPVKFSKTQRQHRSPVCKPCQAMTSTTWHNQRSPETWEYNDFQASIRKLSINICTVCFNLHNLLCTVLYLGGRKSIQRDVAASQRLHVQAAQAKTPSERLHAKRRLSSLETVKKTMG